MNISQNGIAITKRFFEAIEKLRELKKIRGLKTFTSKHDINYWNICTVKNQPEKSVLKPEWLGWLVEDYNVSSSWLLTGEGTFISLPHTELYGVPVYRKTEQEKLADGIAPSEYKFYGEPIEGVIFEAPSSNMNAFPQGSLVLCKEKFIDDAYGILGLLYENKFSFQRRIKKSKPKEGMFYVTSKFGDLELEKSKITRVWEALRVVDIKL